MLGSFSRSLDIDVIVYRCAIVYSGTTSIQSCSDSTSEAEACPP